MLLCNATAIAMNLQIFYYILINKVKFYVEKTWFKQFEYVKKIVINFFYILGDFKCAG